MAFADVCRVSTHSSWSGGELLWYLDDMWKAPFLRSLLCCCADQKIALLGAMQSLFEGSMYTFVFLWTPALSPHGEHLPHGMIFACFMVSAMIPD